MPLASGGKNLARRQAHESSRALGYTWTGRRFCMPERTTVQAPSEAAGRWAGLGPEALIQVFRTMYMSRRLDDREILLKRQNRVFSR